MELTESEMSHLRQQHSKVEAQVVAPKEQQIKKDMEMRKLTERLKSQQIRHDSSMIISLNYQKQKETEQILEIRPIKEASTKAYSELPQAQDNQNKSTTPLNDFQEEFDAKGAALARSFQEHAEKQRTYKVASREDRQKIPQEKRARKVQRTSNDDVTKVGSESRDANSRIQELEALPKYDEAMAQENVRLKSQLRFAQKDLKLKQSEEAAATNKAKKFQLIVGRWGRNELMHPEQNQMQRQLGELQTAHTSLQAELGKVKTERQEIHTKYEKSEKLYTKLQNDHAELQHRHTTIQEQQTTLKDQHDDLQGQFTDLEATHKSLDDKYQQLQRDNNQSETQIQQLQRELQSANELGAQLRKELQTAREIAKNDEAQMKTIENKYLVAARNSQEQAQEIAALSTTIGEQKTRNAEIQDRLTNKSKQLSTLQGQDQANRNSAQTEIDHANSDRAEALQQLADRQAADNQAVKDLAKLKQLNQNLFRIPDEQGMLVTIGDRPSKLALTYYEYRDDFVQNKARDWVQRLDLQQPQISPDGALRTATTMLIRAKHGLCPSYTELQCIIGSMAKSYSDHQLLAYLETTLEVMHESPPTELDNFFVLRAFEFMNGVTYRREDVRAARERCRELFKPFPDLLQNLSTLQKVMLDVIRQQFGNGGGDPFPSSLTGGYQVGDIRFIRDGDHVLVVEQGSRVLQFPIAKVCCESCQKRGEDHDEWTVHYATHIFVIGYPVVGREIKLHLDWRYQPHKDAVKYFAGLTMNVEGSDQC